jgi:hypothetical protein
MAPRILAAAFIACLAVVGSAAADTSVSFSDYATDYLRRTAPACLKPSSALNLVQKADCESAMAMARAFYRFVNAVESAKTETDETEANRQRARERGAAKHLPPGTFEVCGSDRWRNGRWEPSCSVR